MGNIIKVNFNNTRIKLPVLEPPIINKTSLTEIFIINPNTCFDYSKIIIYLNDKYLLATETFNYKLTLPEDFLQTLQDSQFKISIVLQNTISKLTKEQRFDSILDLALVCSENTVCSAYTTVSDFKGG